MLTKTTLRPLGLFIVLLCLTAPAFAFGGCVDSPENPTLLLGALGGTAASLPWLRAQLKARFGSEGKH